MSRNKTQGQFVWLAAWFALLAVQPGLAADRVAAVAPGACCTNHGCELAYAIGGGFYCCNGACQPGGFGGSCAAVCCRLLNGQYAFKSQACCTTGTVSGQDCNGNGYDDRCELANNDCNANGSLDDCDITAGTSADVNGNGVPDECEDCDGDGTLDVNENNPHDQDCDGNGICNDVDIANCFGGPANCDCDANGLPDLCETDPYGPPFTVRSPNLGPLESGSDATTTYTVADAPDAVSDVTLSFKAVGDLDESLESVRVRLYPCVAVCLSGQTPAIHGCCGGCSLGWCSIGNVFTDRPNEANSCAAPPATDSLQVPEALFNRVVTANGGNLQIQMSQTPSVGACTGSYIAVTVTYPAAEDCDGNYVPDECDPNCNNDGVPDACEANCDGAGLPDECDPDCQPNGLSDVCDIRAGTSQDCSGPNWAANGIPDECDIASCTPGNSNCADCLSNGVPDGCEPDCQPNGIADACDIAGGTSEDCSAPTWPSNGVPDECDIAACPTGNVACDDCNANGVPDACDIAAGTSPDCNTNGVPDACDIADCSPGDPDCADCQPNGVPDACDIAGGVSSDCNGNDIPDTCDLRDCPVGQVWCDDCQPNGVLDDCEPDCSGDGVPDTCEANCDGAGLPDGCDPDCQPNGSSDVCEILAGTSDDCNDNGTPDECDPSADVAGARYVELTPAGFYLDDFNVEQHLAELTSYGLLVFPFLQGTQQCDPLYVQSNGRLGTTPFAQNPADWCTKYMHDAVVIPGATYQITADDGMGPPIVLGAITTPAWGDVDLSMPLNILDIVCAINCFKGVFTSTCTRYSCDLAPAISPSGECLAPNGVINILDIVAVIDALLRNLPYPCPEPCFTGPPAQAASAPAIATLDASESQGIIAPNQYVTVDVFGSSISDLRAYEVSTTVTGGTSGSLALVDTYINEAHASYVFKDLRIYNGEQNTYVATDLAGRRFAAVAVWGSANPTGSVYLGTFKYRASSDASGTFTITPVSSGAMLLNSSNVDVGVASAANATVAITSFPKGGVVEE